MSALPDNARALIYEAWSTGEVKTMEELPPSIADFVRVLLKPVAQTMKRGEPFIPERHGYLYAMFCLPLMMQGVSFFGYIGSRSSRSDFRTYPGTSTHEECIQAQLDYPPGDWVKVCIGIYPSKNLERMEKMAQRALGVKPHGGHDLWWNKTVFGGNYWSLNQDSEIQRRRGNILVDDGSGNLVRAVVKGGKLGSRAVAEREKTDPAFRAKMQAVRSATGKIAGKIGGKISGQITGKSLGRKYGPAAAADMHHRSATLRKTNDPGFWPRVAKEKGLPLIALRQNNAARDGFDIPPGAVIVAVAVQQPTRGATRSNAKSVPWKMAILDRGFCTFAEHCADRARLYPRKGDQYGSQSGARKALSRDSARGLFCICCPETGRILRGPGMDQDTLRWTGGGWRRGRVISRGPYGWAHTTP